MDHSGIFALLLCVCLTSVRLGACLNTLPNLISALNEGLKSSNNIICTEHSQTIELRNKISQAVSQVPTSLISGDFSELPNNSVRLNAPILMMLPHHPDQTLRLFKELPTKMQTADFLIVGNTSMTNWRTLLLGIWEQGYANVLLCQTDSGQDCAALYTAEPGRKLQLQRTSAKHYLRMRRHWFDDMDDIEVRVGVYNNPPRDLVYPDRQIYRGYALMLVREFLAQRRAKFVPVLMPNYKFYSPEACMELLPNNSVDLCADLVGYNNDFSFTDVYTHLVLRLLIPNSRPMSKSYYIVAPFPSKVWLLVAIYISLMSGYMSCVFWLQRRRFIFIKFLLDILRSLLYMGFKLPEIRGRVHYILFWCIFIAGFLYSSFYSATLNSIITTSLYEPQINSFEELAERNISIIIGEYDKPILEAFGSPDILWKLMRIMPGEFIQAHRRIFDANYTFLEASDRTALFEYQQQFMIKPRMRPLPIDLVHVLIAYPMSRNWLLKHKLSEALLNCFGSGLLQKLVDDSSRETILVGHLSLMETEPREAQPLTLDYFALPLIIWALGHGLAFLCLLMELLWSRV